MAARSGHIESLDGLRGMAAMLVLLAHSTEHGLLFAHGADALGAVGVTIFFTLSGFLMAYLYSSEPLTKEHVFRYGVNRFSRIAPLYLIAIVVSYLVVKFIDKSFIYQINDKNILRHIFFSGNVEVFWSIPPECQFYVFFLLFWWAINRCMLGQHLPCLILIFASLVMFILGPHLPGTSLPSKYGFFIGGAIAGLVRRRFNEPSIYFGLISALQFVTSFFVVLIPIFSSSNLVQSKFIYVMFGNLYFSPIYIFSVTMLVYLISFDHGLLARCFSFDFMRRLGYWSFAIYILHDPMIYIARSSTGTRLMNPVVGEVFVVAMTIILAAMVQSHVEAPLQKLIKTFAAKLKVAKLMAAI